MGCGWFSFCFLADCFYKKPDIRPQFCIIPMNNLQVLPDSIHNKVQMYNGLTYICVRGEQERIKDVYLFVLVQRHMGKHAKGLWKEIENKLFDEPYRTTWSAIWYNYSETEFYTQHDYIAFFDIMTRLSDNRNGSKQNVMLSA
jgi:hypothetical protein